MLGTKTVRWWFFSDERRIFVPKKLRKYKGIPHGLIVIHLYHDFLEKYKWEEAEFTVR